MPIIDILIAVAVLVSIIVGVFRGFVKEAISIAALLIAIWAALYFGPEVGDISDNWFKSEELQMWFGRVLVFLVILALGGLLGWGISKLVHHSVLSAAFGLARGIVLVAVAIIGGEFAGFDNDSWWLESSFIPQIEVVADWIKVMAPEGLDIITPDEQAEELPIEI
jgi:membrane protein required for colicin V production